MLFASNSPVTQKNQHHYLYLLSHFLVVCFIWGSPKEITQAQPIPTIPNQQEPDSLPLIPTIPNQQKPNSLPPLSLIHI